MIRAGVKTRRNSLTAKPIRSILRCRFEARKWPHAYPEKSGFPLSTTRLGDCMEVRKLTVKRHEYLAHARLRSLLRRIVASALPRLTLGSPLAPSGETVASVASRVRGSPEAMIVKSYAGHRTRNSLNRNVLCSQHDGASSSPSDCAFWVRPWQASFTQKSPGLPDVCAAYYRRKRGQRKKIVYDEQTAFNQLKPKDNYHDQ